MGAASALPNEDVPPIDLRLRALTEIIEMAKWFIQRNGKQAGPFVSAQLKQLAAEGKIRPEDQIRRDDQDKWHRAETVKGLLVPDELKTKNLQEPAISTQQPRREEEITNPIAESLKFEPPPLPNQNHQNRAEKSIYKTTRWPYVVATVFILSVLIILSSSQTKSPPSSQTHSQQKPENSDSKRNEKSKPTAGTSLPDFTLVDYSYDFSNVDYGSIPENATRHETEGQKGDQYYVNVGYKRRLSNNTGGKEGFITHGIQRSYKDSTKKQLNSEYMHFHGKAHGVTRIFNTAGEVVAKVPWVHGQQHGIEIATYKNGNTKMKCRYINGKEHGPREEWYKDGQKKLFQTYVDGKLEGDSIEWYENGVKKEHFCFMNHLLHGPAKRWLDDGTIYYDYSYDHGKIHGRCTRNITKNGEKVMQADGLFRHGKQIGDVILNIDVIGGKRVTFKVKPEPWRSGTRAELMAKMQAAALFIEGGNYYKGASPLLNLKGCPDLFRVVGVSHKDFFDFVGYPSFQVKKKDFLDDFDGSLPFNVLIGYRCTDGDLVFHAVSGYEFEKSFVIERDDWATREN